MERPAAAEEFVWCHAGKPGTSGARPDLSEGTIRHGLFAARLAEDVQVDAGTRTGKLGRGSTAVETHNPGDGYTTVSVTTGDRIGVVHRVSTAFVRAGISIVAAIVVSDKLNLLATEKFKVVKEATNEQLPEEEHESLQDLLILLLDEEELEVETGTVHGACTWLEFDNDSDPTATCVNMTLKSRSGLVRDVTRVLMGHNINIVDFTLTSDGSISQYKMSVTTEGGEKLSPVEVEVASKLLKA